MFARCEDYLKRCGECEQVKRILCLIDIQENLILEILRVNNELLNIRKEV